MQETARPPQSPDADEDGISLLELLTTLGQEKIILFGVPFLTTVIAIVYSLTLPPTFTAKTVMMLPQQQQSAAASALAGLGALAGVAGATTGIKSSDDLYISLFATESLQDGLIERLKLNEHYQAKSLFDARRALTGSVKISSDRRSGLITIEADDKSPTFAAQLANAHVDELRKLLGKLAVTEAQQRRAFFEQHLTITKDKLTAAELRFRQTKEKTGMQATQSLVQESVGGSASLRGQIAAREVQLQAMRAFATPQNPEAQRMAAELAAMRGQLDRIEQGSGAVRSASLEGQQAVEAYRDVKVQEAMLDADMRQLELARADEAREGPLLQQIDIATVPDRRSKPARTQMVLVAGFAGLMLGIMLAFVSAAIRKAASKPELSGRIAAFKRAWSLGSWRGRRPVA